MCLTQIAVPVCEPYTRHWSVFISCQPGSFTLWEHTNQINACPFVPFSKQRIRIITSLGDHDVRGTHDDDDVCLCRSTTSSTRSSLDDNVF
eukprot:SAG11_NODE_3146_length_2650_cov_1.956880_1_plen_91_part_00